MRRLLLVLALAGAFVPASGASAAVPRGWLGVSFGPQYVAAHARPTLASELRRMRRSGVQSARFALYWNQLQPYQSMDAVPAARRHEFRVVEGIPTDLRFTDRLVGIAARRRLPLMPVLLGAPAWATDDPNRPVYVPRDPAQFARFAGMLVRRYGPGGSFWSEHPSIARLPIRSWQIWNEVSNSWYWDSTWRTAYPRLLRAGYDAIKAVDPQAHVLMSGLNTGESGPSWQVLEVLYEQLDAQRLGRPFDQVAAHIYTRRVPDAAKVVEETRKVMERHGDDRPIRVTELAWPAARGRLRDERGHKREFFAATTDRGMAKRLVRGIKLLAGKRKALGISGVDWFQWASSYKGTTDAFSYSGLRRARHKRLTDKPAMQAFRLVAKQLR
jgi:nuclear transport factor 2 (NTF2) superfamily protein